MSKHEVDLQPGETILRKDGGVRHGSWAPCTGELVLTDRALIYVKRGIFGGWQGTIRFPLDEVTQVISGKAQDGSPQLEVYHADGEDVFAPETGGGRTVRSWKGDIDRELARLGKRVEADDGRDEFTPAAFIGDVMGTVAEAGGALAGGIVNVAAQTAKGFVDGIAGAMGDKK